MIHPESGPTLPLHCVPAGSEGGPCPIDMGLPLLPPALAHHLGGHSTHSVEHSTHSVGEHSTHSMGGSTGLGLMLLRQLLAHAEVQPAPELKPAASSPAPVQALLALHDAEGGEWLGQEVLQQAHE